MKQKYQINILEQDLSVLSDSGDDHVASVIQYVESKVREIGAAASNVTALNIAILVALNIADEYIKLAGTNQKLCDEVGSRAESLIGLIDDMI